MEIKDTQPNVLGFKHEGIDKARQDDLRRLKSFDSFIGKILEQVHYINKLKDEQKIAEVENIKERIDRAARKLNDYMNQPEETLDQSAGVEQSNQAGGPDLPIEKHPLLPDMGGMPMELDSLDQAFLNEIMGTDPSLDRTEIQNQIKNKLEAKLKLLNKLKAEIKFKAKNQPSYKPVQKQVNELVMKYKMTLDDMKKRPVLEPEKPQPRPTFTPPTLRPQGF